jgi:DNA-binding XRE family transcriptional regulator
MMTFAEQPINAQTNFGCFLRTLRQRISPQSATLGSWKRLPVRCGRPVSQEEIAEVVGVTRNWYSRLESGEAVRTSVRLVDRLARALASTPEERITLFHLAIPELG